MMGLAESMGQQPVPQSGPMQEAMPTVDEIVALLMQGVDPEKLMEMGVPQEMIMEAIALLEQQMAAKSMPQEQQGLAAQSAGAVV